MRENIDPGEMLGSDSKEVLLSSEKVFTTWVPGACRNMQVLWNMVESVPSMKRYVAQKLEVDL